MACGRRVVQLADVREESCGRTSLADLTRWCRAPAPPCAVEALAFATRNSHEEAVEQYNEYRRQFPFPASLALCGEDRYSDWYQKMAAVWAVRARKETEEAQLGDCDLRAAS